MIQRGLNIKDVVKLNVMLKIAEKCVKCEDEEMFIEEYVIMVHESWVIG